MCCQRSRCNVTVLFVVYVSVTSSCCRLSGGDLYEKLVTSDYVLTEEDCINYMRQVCQGVAHMHKNNILHLDLKVSHKAVEKHLTQVDFSAMLR